MAKIVTACLVLAMSGWSATAMADDAPHHHPGGPVRERLFISPMGEPFRGDDPSTAWFHGVDTKGDGKITQAEFLHDAMRFFAVLDRGHDGEIDPDDIDYYETVLAPEIRTGGLGPLVAKPKKAAGGGRGGHHGGGGGGGMGGGGGGGGMGGGGGGGGMGGGGGGGRGGGGGDETSTDSSSAAARPPSDELRGAARFGYLQLPEPVAAADTSMNRGVSPDEFARAAEKRFIELDRNHDGVLDEKELPKMSGPSFGGGFHGGFEPTKTKVSPLDPGEAPGRVGAD